MATTFQCLSNVTVTDPSLGGTVIFTGIKLIRTGGVVYINSPYKVELNGDHVSISETGSNRRATVGLEETIYRTIGDVKDAIIACSSSGGGGGGGASTNVLIIAGNTLTSTVDGLPSSVNVGQAPVNSATDPTVTDDSAAGHNNGRVWINQNTDTVFLLADNAAGAAVWVEVGSAASVQHNFTAVVDPSVTDDLSGGYSPSSLWLNTATGNIFVLSDSTTGAAVWNLLTEGQAQHNFGAAVDPTVTDDSAAGYSPSSLWLNTSSSQIFVNVDSSTGAASWLVLNATIQHNFTAIVAPTVTDDSSSGYSTSSMWYDSALDQLYIMVASTAGAAVWIDVTSDQIQHNFSATVNPTVTDDSAAGYEQTSLWRNTNTNTLWQLVDATPGSAVWERIDEELNNLTATVDPTSSDDDTAGYEAESLWYNTVNGLFWVCVDNSTGAAVWVNLNASSGGRVTYVSGIAIITATNTGVTYTNDDANGLGTLSVPANTDIYSVNISGTSTETDGSDNYEIQIDYAGTRNHDNDNTDIRYPQINLVNRAAQAFGGPSLAFPFALDDDNTPQRQIIGVGGGTSNLTLRIPSLSSTFSDWTINLVF